MSTTIAFCDFWEGFDPENTYFFPVLRKHFDVRLVASTERPDVLFYSYFGRTHLFTEAGIKVYFTGENDVPNFNQCDYAISFHHLAFGMRHLRLPLYVFYPAFNLLRTNKRSAATADREFCSFVVSNNVHADPFRTEFFHKLSEYKRVNSGGRYLNNIGGPVADKHKFLEQHKFNIAFENSSVDGYTTEKIFDALAAGTLPIYWGNPRVNIDVNPKSFINIANFKSVSEAIEHIIKVDNDNELYNSYMQPNPIEGNQYTEWENELVNFMRPVIGDKIQQRSAYGVSLLDYQYAVLRERLHNIQFVRNNIDKIEQLAELKTKFSKLLKWHH